MNGIVARSAARILQSQLSKDTHNMLTHDDLLLLHLSDLHFGNKNRYSDITNSDALAIGKRFWAGVRQAYDDLRLQRQIDVVIVSGDIAESGKPSEFALGENFLKGLAGEIGISPSQFVFVPGNHDISWAKCKSVDNDIEAEQLQKADRRAQIDARKLTVYDDFIRNFYSRDLDNLSGRRALACNAWIHNFSDLKLSIAALNSCERESHDKGDHIGVVSTQQVQSLLTAWTENAYQSHLKLIVVHHNPVTTTPANIAAWRNWLSTNMQGITPELIDRYESDVTGMEGSECLKQVCESTCVQLVLHGHHHETGRPIGWPTQNGGSTWVLSTGSWGLVLNELPGEEPASCQLLKISLRESPRVFAHRLVFDSQFWLRGDVHQGNFRLSETKSHNDGLRLEVPDSFTRSSVDRIKPPADLPADVVGFLDAYRLGLSGYGGDWDLRGLGATQAGGVGKAVVANLDDMYLPLRFDVTFDPEVTNVGRTLDIEALLARTRQAMDASLSKSRKGRRRQRRPVRTIAPLSLEPSYRPIAIRAAAGSGKTTWMRYTFRALLRTSRALPLMVVLRDVAARWRDNPVGSARSIDQFLDDWVTDRLGGGFQGRVRQLLNASNMPGYDGPRIILLVDGWDELGDFGREFREKLDGIHRLYPSIQIVVSSRPYGDRRPTNSDGYEELTIQPLSPGDIERLSRNFYSRCYALEASLADVEWQKFSQAMDRSPEAATLARTALLLTMMLLISRTEPLPDKRHQLYDRCLHNLLTARPQDKEASGALNQSHHWCPTDSDERRQVVARLAFDLQSRGYEKKDRGTIVATWERFAALLPQEWGVDQRYGFIAWLTGPSGVLTDRSDGTLVFAHLSFQEFLVAWHLKVTYSSDNDLAAQFEQRLTNQKWWETLLLCGALVAAENQKRMDLVLKRLTAQNHRGVSLVGLLCADGVGTADSFDNWVRAWIELLEVRWPIQADRLGVAWKASRQEDRRNRLLDSLRGAASRVQWQHWIRIREWASLILAGVDLPITQVSAFSSAVSQIIIGQRVDDDCHVAVGRFVGSSVPLWPDVATIGALQLWPSLRRQCGMWMQAAVACGATFETLVRYAEFAFQRMRPTVEVGRQDLMRSIYGFHGGLSDEVVARRYAQYDASTYAFVRSVSEKWSRQGVYNWRLSPVSYMFTHGMLENAMSDYGKFSYAISRSGISERHFRSTELFYDPIVKEIPPHWRTVLGIVELFFMQSSAVGRFAASTSDSIAPVARLLRASCRESLEPGKHVNEVEMQLAELSKGLSPVWPALARHLARMSSEEDRRYLIHAATTAESTEDALSQGLRFIVRGDVMLENGEFITLDEIAVAADIELLPILEELPEEAAV